MCHGCRDDGARQGAGLVRAEILAACAVGFMALCSGRDEARVLAGDGRNEDVGVGWSPDRLLS